MTDNSPWMTKSEYIERKPAGLDAEGVDQLLLSGHLAARWSEHLIGTSVEPAEIWPTTLYCWGSFG